MRVLVCGDRNWSDREYLNRVLADLDARYTFRYVIEGEARGADSMARDWALDLAIPVLRFPADWKKYGKAAGPVRNQQMLDEGRPDLVVAFHPDISSSKGTADMVRRAQKAGLAVYIFAGEAVHRFRPCDRCGGSPDIHNTNRGAEFVGHEYA